MQVCPQCQSDWPVNHGSAAGKPKKLCRPCGYQLTRTTPRGKPLTMKVHAVRLYLRGISMPRIAFLLRVSAQSVLNWLRTFAQEHDEQLEPTSRAIILELDERWHDRKQTRRTLWIWKALDRATGPLLDWECGRRDQATLKKLVNRLLPWDVTVYCPATWATYASVIPQDTLVQSKAMTHEIERHHGRQRHGFGRFQRKSIMVSNSQEMVDLPMALFAKFWVNGNQDELLSLLG
jgi:IS1 family transposase/transposase-like protein